MPGNGVAVSVGQHKILFLSWEGSDFRISNSFKICLCWCSLPTDVMKMNTLLCLWKAYRSFKYICLKMFKSEKLHTWNKGTSYMLYEIFNITKMNVGFLVLRFSLLELTCTSLAFRDESHWILNILKYLSRHCNCLLQGKCLLVGLLFGSLM